MRPSRNPSAPALAALATALGPTDPALPFARAVLVQVALAPGAEPDPEEELSTARAIAGLLNMPERPPGSAGPTPALALAGDPVLLAAFFQNIDLLYDAGSPDADRVSGWIMEAVEIIGG